MGREPVCFTCGQPTGPAPRLNLLADGRACPSCRERLLDSLPPALPGFGRERQEEEYEEYGEPEPPYTPEYPGDYRA